MSWPHCRPLALRGQGQGLRTTSKSGRRGRASSMHSARTGVSASTGAARGLQAHWRHATDRRIGGTSRWLLPLRSHGGAPSSSFAGDAGARTVGAERVWRTGEAAEIGHRVPHREAGGGAHPAGQQRRLLRRPAPAEKPDPKNTDYDGRSPLVRAKWLLSIQSVIGRQ